MDQEMAERVARSRLTKQQLAVCAETGCTALAFLANMRAMGFDVNTQTAPLAEPPAAPVPTRLRDGAGVSVGDLMVEIVPPTGGVERNASSKIVANPLAAMNGGKS